MTRPLTRLPLCTIGIVLSIAISGCKKKNESEQVSDPLAGAAGAGQAHVTPAQAAGSMGFAAHMPMDTEAYFGTLNLPKQLEMLKPSALAKNLSAFISDKTPAPSATTQDNARPDIGGALNQLLGRDAFIAVGKGGSAALRDWQSLITLQSEISYILQMKGTTGTAVKGTGKLAQALTVLLDSPDLVQRATDITARLSLPSLMLGVQADKPEEVLKQLVPADLLEQARAKAKISQVTMKEGNFTLIEGTFGAFFSDVMKKGLIDSLPADKPEIKASVSTALESVRAKPFCLAYGTTAGHVIISIGAGRPNLDFATSPDRSLLARPEMSFVLGYAAQNLVGLFFAEAATLEALRDREPLQPIARGMLAGLRGSPMFGAMADALQPKVKELGSLEEELMTRKLTTAAGIAWWDKGLHVELRGGQGAEGLEARKPLRFAPLLLDKSVVAGIAYHGDPAMSAKSRKLFEGWAGLAHLGAQELVKAGLGGKDGPTIAAWVDKDIIPEVEAFYQSTKRIFEKGAGNEHALIFDLGGKVPPLPIFPEAAPGSPPQKMLRLAGLDDVNQRQVLGESWTNMLASLNKITAAFPMLAGQELQDPVAAKLPGGLTTYSYQVLPINGDDLAPCATVGPSVLMIGTSTSQHSDLATRLQASKVPNVNEVARWRVNAPALREALNLAAGTPAAKENIKTAQRWLEVLGEATGRMWIDAGTVRHSIIIEVQDVKRYD